MPYCTNLYSKRLNIDPTMSQKGGHAQVLPHGL